MSKRTDHGDTNMKYNIKKKQVAKAKRTYSVIIGPIMQIFWSIWSILTIFVKKQNGGQTGSGLSHGKINTRFVLRRSSAIEQTRSFCILTNF